MYARACNVIRICTCDTFILSLTLSHTHTHMQILIYAYTCQALQTHLGSQEQAEECGLAR